jgi:hypothetical protein
VSGVVAERRRRAREAAYDRIERQKAAGLLTVRQMTPEERERWPAPTTKRHPKAKGYRIIHQDEREDHDDGDRT